MAEPESTITCPQCGHRAKEPIPADICVAFYRCKGCGFVLKATQGGCCVFCAYGSERCGRCA